MLRLRAWYDGGRVFDVASLEEWKELPSVGALWFALVTDTGVTHFNGGDWYTLEGREWVRYIPSEEWGRHAPHPGGCLDCWKMGVGVSDEAFAQVADEARSWGKGALTRVD